MPEEAKEETPRPKKGKKLILLLPIAFLIIGLAMGAFLLMATKKEADGEKGHKKEKKAKEVAIIDLDPVIVNLFDPSGKRYLQIRLSFEVVDKKVEAEFKRQEPKLKDAIITILSGKTVEEVIIPEAKEKIKKDILNKCNELFGEEMISNVYVTQYIVE